MRDEQGTLQPTLLAQKVLLPLLYVLRVTTSTSLSAALLPRAVMGSGLAWGCAQCPCEVQGQVCSGQCWAWAAGTPSTALLCKHSESFRESCDLGSTCSIIWGLFFFWNTEENSFLNFHRRRKMTFLSVLDYWIVDGNRLLCVVTPVHGLFTLPVL